jgi:hypothetical protein
MNFLVNYSNDKFKAAQQYNTKTALSIGGFSHVFECNPKCIDSEFYKNNASILKQSRGAGYWLWKPYIIGRCLEKIKLGDVLIYSDSGAFFKKSAEPLTQLPLKYQQDIIPFELEWPESSWTKRDAFVLMDCDHQGFEQSRQRLASFIVVRKSAFSIDFINQYTNYCENENILTDIDNIAGMPNYDDFKDHRHDQSVFSLLSKKHGLSAFRDPSQWGNSRIQGYVNSDYEQIIEHTRSKAPKEARLLYRIKRKLFPRNT